MNKSDLIWNNTKLWCRANPNKKAAIATKDGLFTIIFTQFDSELRGADIISVDEDLIDHQWIKRKFLTDL